MKTSANKKWIALVVIIAAGLGYYFFAPKKSNLDATQQLFTVKKGEILQRVTIAGTIEALKSTQVTAPYDGYVQKIFVKIGDKVRANDPVVSISTTLQSTEAVFPIRAPFTGTVVQILKTEGQFVRQGTSNTDYLLRIDDVSRLFVNANVPEIDIVKVKSGQEAIVKASPILDKTYKGIVRDISLAATAREGNYDNASQAEYRVKLEVMDIDDQLKPGMSTILDIIPAKKSDVLSVPHEYIDKKDDKYFVTMKNGERREITIGMQNESVVEVMTGLKENEQIKQVDFIGLGKELQPGGGGRRGR